MAMTVRSEKYIRYAGLEGVSEVVAEIDVDTADELPGIDEISGIHLHQGSVAYVIRTGVFYVLDSDGKWYTRTSADDSEHDYEKISNSEIDQIVQIKPGNTDEEIDAEEIDQDEIDSLF